VVMIDLRMSRIFPDLRVFAGVLACLFLCAVAVAQPPRDNDATKLTNLKVLKEYSDGKGNMIRVLQYSQGGMRVTEQIIIPKINSRVGVRIPIDPDTMKKENTLVIVDKSRYCVRLYVYHSRARRSRDCRCARYLRGADEESSWLSCLC